VIEAAGTRAGANSGARGPRKFEILGERVFITSRKTGRRETKCKENPWPAKTNYQRTSGASRDEKQEFERGEGISRSCVLLRHSSRGSRSTGKM